MGSTFGSRPDEPIELIHGHLSRPVQSFAGGHKACERSAERTIARRSTVWRRTVPHMAMTDDFTGNGAPAFLTLDSRVPAVFRDLLAEADGCSKNNFLTGGTACAQRAIQALLAYEKLEGPDTQSRIRALSEKYPAVPQMLSNVLQQFGDATARDGAKLNTNGLNLLTVTLKAIVYEIYVLGPERAERLQYVRQIFESIERKGSDKRATTGSSASSAAVPVERAS